MNLGKDIDFIVKSAEELKTEEEPVSAPAPTQEETTPDNTARVEPTDPAPTESEATETAPEEGADVEENAEEKTAAEMSAKDKAMELAAKAGRPTGTGIAAGAGLGTILAALGALHRANTPDNSHTFLSNPFLLGALGAAGGYLGGNAFERLSKTKAPVIKKDKSSLLTPAAAGVGALGTLDIGRRLAGLDQAASDKAIDIGYHKMLNRLNKGGKGVDLDGAGVSPETRDKFNELQKKYKRVQERKGYTSSLKGRGMGDPSKMNFMRRMSDSTWNPLNQLKALNPFKEVEGLSSKGPKLLKKQLIQDVLKLKGSGKAPWYNLKAMPPRLAALAAIAGVGTAGVNAIRNAVTED